MKQPLRAGSRSSQLTALLFAVVLAVATSPASRAQSPVLTHRNDNSRSGQNLSETHLTPSVVNSTRFGHLFAQPLDGMAVAEPLYVPNLQINGTAHNVVFIVTLHDGVYAFDADNNQGSNSAPLWYTSLINPPAATTVPIAEQGCIGHNFTEMGILGTPVIDPISNIMYLVAKTKESGSYVFRLHALNIQTGQEALAGPVQIQASYTSNGDVITFMEQHRMNRPALLLSNGVIYIEFGNMGCKSAQAATGWMMAYSASNLQQLGVLDVGPTQASTPGIWMAGEGASVDSNGNVYVATGDGDFDYNIGGLDYGSTLMKVNLGPSGFNLVDYFTPYNQDYLSNNDLDLGSGALVLLPPQPGPYPNLGVLGGKGGMIYLINQDNLGGYNPVADQVVQEVPFNPNDLINLDGGATYWNQNIYFGGVEDGDIGIPVETFSLSNGLLSTSPVAMTAKAYKFFSLFSISANGAQNGILWGVQAENTGSTLNVFNATNLASLFTSPQFELTLHFVTPMIANGRVYITTKNSLVVMGLFNLNVTAGGSNQTGAAGTALKKPLTVRVTNAYTGAVMPGVTINFSDGGSGGTFGNAHPVTNSNGYATTTYTLPAQAGVYKITAAATGFTTAHFTEKATGN
ncbi:MAG TPA: Ig-like domain-containing protein [Candidatus Sulfotelmatobacter sp.]|nr:Ig-like domain-containing protein [Candidatus Sulfotelmatobacter sp.]